MRRRLTKLEAAVGRGDEASQREASVLEQALRSQFSTTLDVETVIRLSRGVHAGNPDALAEWKKLCEAEAAFIAERLP